MEDMIVDATLNSTFDILNKNIDYVVLRGYIPTANLSVIDDIDIFVNPDCKKS